MSLTSYRAAPPRDVRISGPRVGPGVLFDQHLARLGGSRNSYEPDELPGCSTPRCAYFWAPDQGRGIVRANRSPGSPGLWMVMSLTSDPAAPPRGGVGCWSPGDRSWVGGGFGRPGGDLLFRALRRSTIGAEGFHGRVRDGIGCYAPRYGHQAVQSRARPASLASGWSSAAPGLTRGPVRLPAGRSELRVSF
jgi:hypothetical protein